jgi:hypothetical protein
VKNRFWREIGILKTSTALRLAESRVRSQNGQKS